MREIVVRALCDTCGEPADSVYVVGIIDRESRPALRVVDACSSHGVEWRTLMERVAKSAPFTSPPRPLHGDESSAPPSLRAVECEICGDVLVNRSVLRNHIWVRHIGEPMPKTTNVCPECTRVFPSINAIGAHRARAHGFDGVAEAYAAARHHPVRHDKQPGIDH